MTGRLTFLALAVAFILLGLVLALLDLGRGWAFLLLVPLIVLAVVLFLRANRTGST